MKIYIPKKKNPPRVKIKKMFAWYPVKTIEDNLVWFEYVYKKVTRTSEQGEMGYYWRIEVEYSSLDFRIVD